MKSCISIASLHRVTQDVQSANLRHMAGTLLKSTKIGGHVCLLLTYTLYLNLIASWSCSWDLRRCLKIATERDLNTTHLEKKTNFTYGKGGKTRDPLGITILIPCRFCDMSWSSWNHSIEGAGLPEATHSNLAPVELEKVTVLGGCIRHWGAVPRWAPPPCGSRPWAWLPATSLACLISMRSERSVRPPTSVIKKCFYIFSYNLTLQNQTLFEIPKLKLLQTSICLKIQT